MAAKNVLDLIKRFGLSFRRNWGLKLASLLFAVILWNYVITQVNPTRPVTIRDVPVTFSENGITVLNNSDFTVRGAIPDSTIDVTVEVRRNDVPNLKKDMISATVDLSGIASDGEKEVKIGVGLPAGTTLKSISPDTIKVSIERLEKRPVPVKCEPQGDLPQGYWHDIPVLNNTTLQVSGASSLVRKVASARITVSLAGLTENLSAAREITLLDIDGNVLGQGGLKIEPSSCIVNMDVFPTNRVPIDAGSSISGDVADGYVVADVRSDPVDVLLAGPRELLDSIKSVTAKPVDLSGIDASFSVSRPLEVPEGIHVVGESAATVHVTVETKMTTFTVNNVPVKIEGLGTGLKMDSKQPKVAVTVTCPELLAPKVNAASLHLTTDATGLAAGSHALLVICKPDSDLGIASISVNPEKVLVTLAAMGGT